MGPQRLLAGGWLLSAVACGVHRARDPQPPPNHRRPVLRMGKAHRRNRDPCASTLAQGSRCRRCKGPDMGLARSKRRERCGVTYAEREGTAGAEGPRRAGRWCSLTMRLPRMARSCASAP